GRPSCAAHARIQLCIPCAEQGFSVHLFSALRQTRCVFSPSSTGDAQQPLDRYQLLTPTPLSRSSTPEPTLPISPPLPPEYGKL
ncbi:hypothetical protein BV25DRAFT_1939913, partial [Artomyces pyxidatus]